MFVNGKLIVIGKRREQSKSLEEVYIVEICIVNISSI